MWINNFPLGHIKLTAIYAGLAGLTLFFFKTGYINLAFSTIGVICMLSAILAYLIGEYGLTIRRKRFSTGETLYEVQDTIFPTRLKTSYRDIVLASDNRIIQSRDYIFGYQIPWLIFDFYRIILEQKQNNLKKVLLLGGGGGVIAKNLTSEFRPALIDVIEISPEMIRVAMTYFGVNMYRSIHMHELDAALYMRKNKKYYDLIIIDIADKTGIPLSFANISFIKKLRQDTELLFINLGYYTHIEQFIKNYKHVFPDFSLYLYQRNLIGTNKPIPEKLTGLPKII